MALVLVGAAGLTARKIPVACAFHSPVVAAARDGLARVLAGIDLATPRIPVFSNTTAAPYPSIQNSCPWQSTPHPQDGSRDDAHSW
jgi:acyl transferase domain-containing protein